MNESTNQLRLLVSLAFVLIFVTACGGATTSTNAANSANQFASTNSLAAAPVTMRKQSFAQVAGVTSNTDNPVSALGSAFSNIESTRFSFNNAHTGRMPQSGLLQASDGNFYGTTTYGGAYDEGTVYSLTPEGVQSLIWSFSGNTDGAYPIAPLLQATDGNFYSTTAYGGTYDKGTFYRVSPTGQLTVLWSFGGNGDAANPIQNLIQASDGNFYGVTVYGGAFNYGTVYKMTPTGVESVLWSFGGSGDGIFPYAGIALGNDGNLYGTTEQGGAHGYGSVYKLTLTGSESVLWSFSNSTTDGRYPESALIQTPDGNLYGSTNYGGAYNGGTIFKITPEGNESLVWQFGAAGDAAHPTGPLVQGPDGAIYGTSVDGGLNTYGGTIFRFWPLVGAVYESVLWSFGNAGDGSSPSGGVIFGTDYHLYGTTWWGGSLGNGTVFSLTLVNSQ